MSDDQYREQAEALIADLRARLAHYEALVVAAKAEGWDEAVHHVEPYLTGAIKRAAMKDNPYRGGDQ